MKVGGMYMWRGSAFRRAMCLTYAVLRRSPCHMPFSSTKKGRCNAMQYNGTAQRQRKSYVMLLLLYMIALACHAIQLNFFFIQFCS